VTRTYIVDDKLDGLILHRLDRLTGERSSTESWPRELWMLSTPPPEQSMTFVGQKQISPQPVTRLGLSMYKVDIGETFEIVEAQTLPLAGVYGDEGL
jgi:hypothetical protein